MRKHNYVVGFEGEGNVAYGKDREESKYRVSGWTHLLTLFQAKQQVKKLSKPNRGKRYIYKLVKVESI